MRFYIGAWRDVWESTGGQVIAIPSALTFVTILFVDVVQAWWGPLLAAILTALLVVIAYCWVARSLEGRPSNLRMQDRRFSSVDRSVDGLVLVVSKDATKDLVANRSPRDLRWLESIPGFLVSQTGASVIGLLHTPESRKDAERAREIIESGEDGKDRKVILEALDSAPSSDELTLVQRHEQAMQRLIRQVRDAVAGSDHPTIYADVTGGMKPHSIALYRAAERELATVTYVVLVNKKPDSLMVLAEPEVLSKNREEVG